MKALVIGFGKSGRAAAELLLCKGYEVVVVEKDIGAFLNYDFDESRFKRERLLFCLEDSTKILEDKKRLDIKSFDPELKEIDFLVLSSGISQSHNICLLAKENNIPIISEADLAFEYLKNRAVAITGTNGKTTTTKLVEFILNDNGMKAFALGNVGRSLCSYVLDLEREKQLNPKNDSDLDKPSDDILVVELSSFQLDNLRKKVFDIGVILNIKEDHINWHLSFENYIKAKMNLSNCLKVGSRIYISKQIKEELALFLPQKYSVFDEKDPFKRYKDIEKNENISAAFMICKKFGIDKKRFMASVKKFVRPKHRIEFVDEINGISFFNDSKSTNISSTIYAVNNLPGPIILIAGGEEKNLDFTPWKNEVVNKVKYIYLIGRCATRIKEVLNSENMEIVYTLDNALKKAYNSAEKGDKILLSPGCSSYDQFKNYEHRGETFVNLVKNMEKGRK